MASRIDRKEIEEIRAKISLYISVGRHEAAEKLIKSTLSDYGSMANLHNLLGTIYHKQSKFLDAVKQFELALRINQNFVEAGLNLAATLCDLGRYEEARSVFGGLKNAIDPNKKQPLLLLGRLANKHADCGKAYEDSQMLNEAAQEYRKALSLYTELPDVRYRLAKIYMTLGKFEKAKVELETIVKNNPDTCQPLSLLGVIYNKLGKIGLAKDFWLKAQQVDPRDPVSKAYLAITQ